MRINKLQYLLFLIPFICIACGKEEPQKSTKVMIDVVRVMYHENKEFTFFVAGDKNELHYININFGYGDNPKIIRDVPKDKNMWVIYERTPPTFSASEKYDNVEIHIHSVDDINGAGWNHGKFGSGSTSVIE